MGYAIKSEADGGLGSYSAQAYADLDMGEYRTRFPDETASLTDEQLFHAVSHQDDDRDPDEWRAIFKAA